VCGKTFAGRTELATHQTVHTGKRPYVCNLCGKDFRLKGVLRMHARVHAGERRAVCDTCGKRFLQASDLNKHKLAAHSDEKPFACDICSRAFARRDYLKAHMKIHQQPAPLLADEHGFNPIGLGGVKRTSRTRKPRGRHIAVDLMTAAEQETSEQPTGYSPDIEESLILDDVPMALSSIVEGSETLLVVTNLDDSKDLVIEEFKSDSLMADGSGFL
jgi:Zinc finger, C2H2 type/C2H2-type zinc finger